VQKRGYEGCITKTRISPEKPESKKPPKGMRLENSKKQAVTSSGEQGSGRTHGKNNWGVLKKSSKELVSYPRHIKKNERPQEMRGRKKNKRK